MIAKTVSGPAFAPIARYLAGRDEGVDPTRVAWTSSRNLVTDDPSLSADVMQATASQNPRVEMPAYHLALSFAPEDHPTREMMEQAADRVLADLGLAGHQALLVAHHDRDHQHVHLLVNRIHPETFAPWDRWHDHSVLDRVLADLETTLALRRVVERDERLADRTIRIEPTREAARTRADDGRPLVARLRQLVPEIRASQSWQELRDRLNAHGVTVERRAHGLVFADATGPLKASRVAADTSLSRLEARLGPFPADRAPEVTRATEPARSPYETAREIDAATQRLRQAEWAIDRADRSALDTSRAFSATYRDPNAALTTLLRYADVHNIDRATDALRQHPERFGTLVTVDRRRAFGLWTSPDEGPARAAAAEAASLAREWIGHAHHARDLLQIQRGTSADSVRNALADLRTATHDQIARLRGLPSVADLTRLPPSPSKEITRAIGDTLRGREMDRER